MKQNNYLGIGQNNYLGIGPVFLVISTAYSIFIFLIYKKLFPDLKFVLFSKITNIILGTILIFTGVIIFFISLAEAFYNFKKNKLYTGGIYSVVRHPMYSSWIILIVPGIIIVSGSIPGISVPILLYITFKVLIENEEKLLEKKYKEEFLQYKRKVGSIFPKLTSLIRKLFYC